MHDQAGSAAGAGACLREHGFRPLILVPIFVRILVILDLRPDLRLFILPTTIRTMIETTIDAKFYHPPKNLISPRNLRPNLLLREHRQGVADDVFGLAAP